MSALSEEDCAAAEECCLGWWIMFWLYINLVLSEVLPAVWEFLTRLISWQNSTHQRLIAALHLSFQFFSLLCCSVTWQTALSTPVTLWSCAVRPEVSRLQPSSGIKMRAPYTRDQVKTNTLNASAAAISYLKVFIPSIDRYRHISTRWEPPYWQNHSGGPGSVYLSGHQWEGFCRELCLHKGQQ